MLTKQLRISLDWSEGADERLPSRPIKNLPPRGALVEITTRTIHRRFLMKPGTRSNEIILGVLGRALHLHPQVRLHGFWFLSNHYNLLAYFPDVFVMAAFMGHLNSCLARELGMHHRWREKFFGRRYRGIALADVGSQVPRFAYLLAQGTKEGLVARPDLWPGASCLRTVLTGAPIFGKWTDRTSFYRARRRNPHARMKDFVVTYEIPIHPLPCWQRLSPAERQSRTREVVTAIEEKARALNESLGRKPMGAERVLNQNPHSCPETPSNSPAPLCHASSRRRYQSYAAAYRDFVKQYRAASNAFRAGDLTALDRFPPGCFRPPSMPRRPAGPNT